MNNFWTRTITGALFVAVMVFCIWFSYWTMTGLFFLIIVLGLWEFYSLLEKANYNPQKISGTFLGGILFLFCTYFLNYYLLPDYFPRINFLIFPFAVLFPFVLLLLLLFSKNNAPIVNISITLFGILYVSVPFSLWSATTEKIVFIHDLGEKVIYCPYYILGFFFLMWSNDTFAYLVGRAIGKTKLWERISPKKTWEGFAGGLILTQGTAYIISIYFTELALIHWLVIAVIVSVFGTLGDLVESMFKRSLNVKDSGGILPGHGGILDRFDGVLLASPFVCTYLLLIR